MSHAGMSDHGIPGTARFEVLRRLGAGGMGVVYEAFDRERNRRVALKTFRDISNDAVLRFKDEFRALQGVHHDNLVKLYELFEDAGRWFFTMELIDGFDIVHHVAASSVGPSDSVLERDETVDIFTGQPPASAAVPAFAPGTPSDLSDLAMALLRREPDQRPTSAEIFDRLRVHRARSSSRSPLDRVFVGREKELAELVTAFAEARTKTVAAVVRGESGVGKSQLVRQFNDTVTERERDTIVLGGRCYERESVPYKAFDGIVAELARMLARRPADELADLLPARVAFAAQMFPVLRSVAALAARPRPPEASDPQQQRALLFAAVRELFGALAARYRLVLVIDDLQWTDAESLALLRELLRSVAM